MDSSALGEKVMKTVVVILSIALVGVGGGAIHLWRELDASRHRIDELQAQVEGLEASARRVAAMPPVSAAPPPVGDAAAAKPAQPADRTAALAAALAAATANSRENAEALRATMASPENQERARALFRSQLPVQYPDVGKALGLSPEEVERLFDMLAKQNAERSRAISGNGPDTGAQALARQMAGEQAELASVLGDKFDRWKEYNTQLPTRRQLKDLGAVLNASGAPLTDAQANSLIPALASVEKETTQQRMSQAPQQGGLAVLNRYTPEANQRLVDAAAPHLTPQQLEAYRQMLDREAARQRALLGPLMDAQKAMEAQRKSEAGAAN
jgi:hypothetical protein